MEEQAPAAQVQTQSVDKQSSVLKSFPKKAGGKSTMYIVLGSLLVVLVGVGSGWLLSGRALGTSSKTSPEGAAPGAEKSLTEAGVSDLSDFPDEAEGMLVEGGIEGEGTHYLDRELGQEKNVYLTSTVIDLQSLVGKKVKVWGQTISGKYAGWLMDVGKIKVIE